jgi:hypothetical protein
MSKPLKMKLQDVKLAIRRGFELPDEDFIERFPDTKWRPVAADIDDEAFEGLLNHLEYNWFWYWNGLQRIRDAFRNDFKYSNYEVLARHEKDETEKAIQERRSSNPRRRRRSLDPVQLRYSYYVILNDEYNDNTEKTPFEHYFDNEFFSTEQPLSQKRRRSASLPPYIQNPKFSNHS